MIHQINYKQILIVLCICFYTDCFSQIKEQNKDSTEVIYKKVEDYSEKSKLTKLLHKLIVKPQQKPAYKTTMVQNQSYREFEGKIIRNIIVESHDPFGVSLRDSTVKVKNWFEKAGNKVHVRSKDFAIKNYIIFKKNSPLDSLKIIESKRLIRSQKFIREVEVTVKAIAQSPDSVDVHIATLDSWSLVPSGKFSDSKMKLQIREQNYLGYGHELKLAMNKRYNDGKIASDLLYRIPNFKNTYISTTIKYINELDGSYSKRFNTVRPFFSPYTKWAAGLYLGENFSRKLLPNANMELSKENFKYQSQDIWAGYSINLFKGKSERERSTNIISALRLLHIDYKERPSVAYDSIRFYSNETFYLASIGLSSRQFIEDNYLFRDGITENVPIGDVFAFTIGNRYKNQQNRLYLGGRIAHGNYYNWGYFSTSFELETFIKKSKSEQTTYSFGINYFTKLISLGDNWKMRQFIKPQFIIGVHRLNSDGDRVTIDDTDDFQSVYATKKQQNNSIYIPDFNTGLLGTSKYGMTLQTQFYPPWQVIGFRFNPYLKIQTAMLGDENKQAINPKVYSSFGIGMIIRNDYLVFNSIQLSLNYYPHIPEQGTNIFNTNTISVRDFGLQGFELGKPSPIRYN